ncbi:ABC transporter substrate-binding protein [Nakamurella lactea]|uniref:ABC transporter substrate-binding protein n=1 Tax=Nakamurella lactea TaxID=459515 RepID=UPI0012B63EE6|nr:ABC transporter substrate-binding protein [Nakamurella lactea]
MTVVAAVGVIALVTAACSSNDNTASSAPSSPSAAAADTSSAADSGSASASTSASSSAPASESSSSSGGSESSSASTDSGSGSDAAHGGVTLVDSAPLATTQGTKPLVVENNPIPSLEDNFNAFNSNGFGYKLNVEGLFYEPMLMFNALKANTAYPWLATDFAWNDDGTAITFTLRDGVKFSDGSPLTADDVAYTYQAMKDFPAANRSGLPIASAAADGTNKVTVKFTAPQFQNIYNVAGQTFIVKKSAYSGSGDPSKFADPQPIGTGPYTLAKFTPQGLQFKANPSYWGGTPPVPEVDVPSYTSNDVALQQLSAGKIHYAGNFVSNIEQSFVAKDPANHKYWFPAINTVGLVFNVSTGPEALKDPAVRKAISVGLDRKKVADQAEQGYEAPASSSSGLLLPNFDSLLPAAYKDDLKPGQDAAAVTTLMTGAGYAKDGNGMWAKGGKTVSFSIEDPTAYTDYYQAAQIMSADLKAVGFDAKVNGVDANKWYADLAAGTFDSAIHWGTTSPSPYAQYDGWLDPEVAKGDNASGNYGRFNDPAATKALADYAKAGSEAESKAAIETLAKVMSEQVPVAPIMYAAGWYEYNTTDYTGWVDKDNQYMDPSPNPANVAYVILHLSPKG